VGCPVETFSWHPEGKNILANPYYLMKDIHMHFIKRGTSFLSLSLLVLSLSLSFRVGAAADNGSRPPTFCNPVNLPYRFALRGSVRREAADPTMVIYKNEYWLFPSKSGGYWHSPDCLHWTYVPCVSLQPIESYAPTVEVVNGRMLWTACGQGIWANDDPLQDTWKKVSGLNCGGDPDLFLSKDGRLFLYQGLSDNHPTTGVELDVNTLQPIGKPADLIVGDPANRGWEALKGPGKKPFIEGSWMTEHDGTFYLQYAAPGTEVNDYGDGVFTSKDPLGPFTYAPYTPFSFKPTGFIASAGHSSTFQDLSGNYWHVSTMRIGIHDWFERRVGLFPAGFTPDGQLYCNTYLGDYPQYPPGVSVDPQHPTPGWMLLSYNKAAEASSTLDGFPVKNAFDESVRDWWSATSGDKGEWLKVDLGKSCRIEAIQTNFADQDAKAAGMLKDGDAYQYVIEVSDDGTAWTPCIDKSQNQIDAPHDYVQLPAPVTARYVRLTNVHCPAGAKLSVSGFRIFGNGLGTAPAMVEGVTATRDADPRKAIVSWAPIKDADFYIVRYGLAPDRLFSNYQVYAAPKMTLNALNPGVSYAVTVDAVKLTLNALNAGVSYVVTVDAVNDSGITQGTQGVPIP
jgi:xylan 1,4-beta-xylosidase